MRLIAAATIAAGTIVAALLSGSATSEAPVPGAGARPDPVVATDPTPTPAATATATPALPATPSPTPGAAATPTPGPGATPGDAPTPDDDLVIRRPVLAVYPLVRAARSLVALSTEEIIYRAARHDFDGGDAAAAAGGFARVVAGGGTLAPAARLRLAQALVRDGRLDEASGAFADAIADRALPSALRVVALMEHAALLADSGAPDAAVEALARVAGEPGARSSDRAQARLGISTIRLDAGNAAWYEDALAAMQIAPGTAAAAGALDALESNDAFVPPLLGGYVRYLQRANGAATEYYEGVVERPGENLDRANAWFYLGALAERRGARTEALRAYANSIDLAPFGPLADDAHYWRGRVAEELGETTLAVSEFDIVAASFSTSTFAADAEIRAAVDLGLDGDAVAALGRLESIAARRGGATGAEAARWHRVIADHRGLTATPLDPAAYDPGALGSVIDADAMLPLPAAARDEWPRPVGDEAQQDAWLLATTGSARVDPSSLVERADVALALALARAGEPAVARGLLRDTIRALADDPGGLLALSRLAVANGLHDVSYIAGLRLLAPFSSSELLELPASVVSLAYPNPYPSELADASVEFDVPALLMLALVRQESAFDPGAGSSAGAFGLTQVIEPTGREIARQLDEEWSMERLRDPATSLRFGAYYLAQQLAAFDGNVFAALAAYNGGPGNAARWLGVSVLPGADGFLHAVDFVETRRYLERVLENYAWYRYLHAGAARPTIR